MSIGTSAIGVSAIGTLPLRQVLTAGTLADDTVNVTMSFTTDGTIGFNGLADIQALAILTFFADGEIIVGGSAASIVLPTSWTPDQGVTGVWTPDNPIKGT